MSLSSELIDQLVKVTQNTEPRDKDNTAYGTVVIMGSKKYVKIDGSTNRGLCSTELQEGWYD